jgi:hypothetical protein
MDVIGFFSRPTLPTGDLIRAAVAGFWNGSYTAYPHFSQKKMNGLHPRGEERERSRQIA